MDTELARHNNKILETKDDMLPKPRCNCQAALRNDCPLPGYCTAQCVVYRALVTSGDPTTPKAHEVQTYTGLTENYIKKRMKFTIL